MTGRDRRVLDAIQVLIDRHGYSPSYAEIAEEIGIRSRGDVHASVKKLLGLRYVTQLEGETRTLRLTSLGRAQLHGMGARA